jgi:hypothetical protein
MDPTFIATPTVAALTPSTSRGAHNDVPVGERRRDIQRFPWTEGAVCCRWPNQRCGAQLIHYCMICVDLDQPRGKMPINDAVIERPIRVACRIVEVRGPYRTERPGISMVENLIEWSDTTLLGSADEVGRQIATGRPTPCPTLRQQ